jgi:predicted MPP superfamily phosphohydrolase
LAGIDLTGQAVEETANEVGRLTMSRRSEIAEKSSPTVTRQLRALPDMDSLSCRGRREAFVMEDMHWKRLAIERGLLKTWARRGRGRLHAESLDLLCTMLKGALRLAGLRALGERNARKPIVRAIRFTYDALPEGFCGFKILHLSDIHADGLAGLSESISAGLQGLEADLCVLTGDYRFEVNGPCDRIYPPMEKILSSINARLGIVGILGNHDAAEEASALERLGVKMLVNDALELCQGRDKIWIIGVDDPHYYGCDDLPGAMHAVPPDAFKILLVHTPEIIEEASFYGIDLYLCGHTHGGQICLPWIGPIIVNANCPRKFTQGVWRYKHMQGYTSAGVGTSGVPVRFFCPPELALIELRCSRHQDCQTILMETPWSVIREEVGRLSALVGTP